MRDLKHTKKEGKANIDACMPHAMPGTKRDSRIGPTPTTATQDLHDLQQSVGAD